MMLAKYINLVVACALAASTSASLFEVKKPKGWGVVDSKPGFLLIGRKGSLEAFASMIGVEMHRNSGDKDRDEVQGRLKFLQTSQIPNDATFKSSKPADTVVAGRKALRIRRSFLHHVEMVDNPGGKVVEPYDAVKVEEYVIIPVDDGYYELNLWASEKDFPKALPDFEKVLAGFKLVPRKTKPSFP